MSKLLQNNKGSSARGIMRSMGPRPHQYVPVCCSISNILAAIISYPTTASLGNVHICVLEKEKSQEKDGGCSRSQRRAGVRAFAPSYHCCCRCCTCRWGGNVTATSLHLLLIVQLLLYLIYQTIIPYEHGIVTVQASARAGELECCVGVTPTNHPKKSSKPIPHLQLEMRKVLVGVGDEVLVKPPCLLQLHIKHQQPKATQQQKTGEESTIY